MFRAAIIQIAIVTCLVGCTGEEEDRDTESPAPSDADPQAAVWVSPYADKEYIDDIYIPANLEECFIELDKMMSSDEKERFKNVPEDDVTLYHHGPGTWIRNNWGLWRGSRIAQWFRDRGALHPDDMSSMILDSYWRKLNDKPIKLEEQIKYYKDYWANRPQPSSGE